jgi:hypothetical protein
VLIVSLRGLLRRRLLVGGFEGLFIALEREARGALLVAVIGCRGREMLSA